MKAVTILSGKGGVGKSSITASLAIALSEHRRIICADCDVDASNLSLVLGAENAEWKELSTNQKAYFDLSKCSSCRKCYDACYFKAIAWKNDKPALKGFSCEGCGVCQMVCPEGAIKMEDVDNARLGYSRAAQGFLVVSAELNPGESGSGKVVSEVRKRAGELGGDADLMLIDSAAGVGCPVIASVTGADHAVIVTEPTPSGFSDMKRALEIVEHFKIPSSFVINKHDINKEIAREIEGFARDKGIEVIARIPFDKDFALALTQMKPIIEYNGSYGPLFFGMAESLLERI